MTFAHCYCNCITATCQSAVRFLLKTAVWVNFFFWLVIGVLVIIQRRQNSQSKVITGGLGGPTGALFGEAGATAAETEPFFNRPARPQ